MDIMSLLLINQAPHERACYYTLQTNAHCSYQLLRGTNFEYFIEVALLHKRIVKQDDYFKRKNTRWYKQEQGRNIQFFCVLRKLR